MKLGAQDSKVYGVSVKYIPSHNAWTFILCLSVSGDILNLVTMSCHSLETVIKCDILGH